MNRQDSQITITLWDDRLTEAAGLLYASEYGGSAESQIARFSGTYNHEFQKGREMRLVAMQGTELVGIQSLFYWPYRRDNTTYNVLQSGNSIIAKQCRGQGLFGRMLMAQDEMLAQRDDIDFLVGFPVGASRGSFLRNGWKPLDDLHWRMRLLNPLNFLRSVTADKVIENISQNDETENFDDCCPAKFRLAANAQFLDWRSQYRLDREMVVSVPLEGAVVTFRLKTQLVKASVVVVVGDIVSSVDDRTTIEKALASLFRILSKAGATGAAICYNLAAETQVNSAIERAFPFKVKNIIHSIVKPIRFQFSEIENPANWVLYRADVDTW